MDEQPTQPQAGEPADAAPPAGATSGTRARTSPPAGDDEVMTLAEARKIRGENANLRDRLEALNQEQQRDGAARQKQLDEVLERERTATTTAAELLVLARRSKADAAVMLMAVELDMNPALAVELMAAHEFKYDDKHQPLDVKEALQKKLEKFPQLKNGGTTAANPAGTRGNQRITNLKDAPSLLDSRLWTSQ